MTDVLGLPAPPNQPIEPARIPSDGELDRWEAQYKAAYRAQHAARNDALDRMATGLADLLMRADVLLATLEAHEAAGDGFVDVGEVDRIARARGRGFSDRRAHIAATWNPYRPGAQTEYHYGSFMAWYAGWKQAGQTVDRNPETRPRGYTPPSGYVCPLCGAMAGSNHTGPKWATVKFDSYDTALLVPCEDHLPVVAPPQPGAKRPVLSYREFT